MSKIETLTPDQEALIPVVRDEWLNLFKDDGPMRMDRPEVEKGVKWLYQNAGLNEPLVCFVESPMGCQLAPHLFKQMQCNGVIEKLKLPPVGDSVRDSVWASVRDSVWDSVTDSVEASVWDSVWASVWAVADSVVDSVADSVADSVGASVADSVWDSVWASVWASVEASVEASVWASVADSVEASVADSVWASVIRYETFSWCCFGYDSDWGAFYEYWERIGLIKDHEPFTKYKDYLKARPFFALFLDGLAVVCEPPMYIKRDGEGRLHCEDGASLEWKDGYRLFFWHGVEVSEKLILRPDEVSRSDILQEENAERRRAMMERLGPRFAELLDLERVGMEYLNGSEVMLMRTREPDNIVGDHLYFVRVICPSTERVYLLPVPPSTDVLGSLAWTFGMSREEYRPVCET